MTEPRRRRERPPSSDMGRIERMMEIQDGAAKFEKGRIQVLQQERVYVQKKTFTKWCNSFLEKAHLQINDLFTDLADGKMLMKLLEIISGESLGRPNKGVLRVQKIENVNRCINFLKTKVRLESIGAEDIVDGNPRLILGLIWTVILRFQIQDIEIQLDEEDETGEKKSAKDALLLWCQRRTHGYPHVKIDNFSTSWRSGMGFNALIHYHRPDLIDYNNLNPHDHIGNLNNAFETAQKHLGIVSLLDAEDVDVPKPDDKSIMTYVASYYHFFAKMKSEMTGGKRVANMLGKLINMEKMEDEYDSIVTQLLDWIYMKTTELKDHNFPNNLEGIQQEMFRFKQYITVEKPPKYKERGDIEGQFFHIQMKRKANGQQNFIPPEGKMLHDINRAWQILEKAEHDRELSLREELIRQERLEQLAAKFERKALLRESWVNEMTKVLSDQNFGKTTQQVEAALKKHEAISSDIEARKDRFIALTNMAQELYHENYHSRDKIKRREHDILGKWKTLIDLLEKRRRMLVGFSDLLNMFREIESIHVELKELEPALLSEDYGKHLFSVDDLLQKHHLVETQMNQLSARVRHLNKQAQPYMKSLQPENQLLQQQLDSLNKEFDSLFGICGQRRTKLDESQRFFQFLADSEEEEAWLIEKTRLVKSNETGNDLAHVMRLLNKHDALEQEMHARYGRCEQVCASGEHLVANQHPAHNDINKRMTQLKDMWARLKDLTAKRKVRLEDAYESQLYYADANETESWMREKMPLVTSEDYGKNEESAKSLLKRHIRVEEEISAYDDDIRRLDHMAVLMTKAANVHKMSPMVPAKRSESDLQDDLSDEEMAPADEEVLVDVPYEYEDVEMVEREVVQEETIEKEIPQVKASYKYEGQGIAVKKGEVLLLLAKTNNDWWSVRQLSGKEGYVPANYVKVCEPKIVKQVVKKPVIVREERPVVKTGIKKEKIKRKRSDPTSATNNNKLRRTASMRSQGNLHFDKVNLEQRQQLINKTYHKLCNLSQDRHRNLEGAIKLFGFYRDCENFEIWMSDKELVLKTPESLSDNMESVRRQFETLITDMAANGEVLSEINSAADEMIRDNHKDKRDIQKRQKDINDRWAYLNKLKMDKERSLQGASSIEIFQNMCAELKDWIEEKTNGLNQDELGKDLNSVQSLQRKHQNLEYEIGPIEDKMSKMNLLANAVRQSYPGEAPHVNAKEKEIMDMWRTLQDKMADRKRRLADAEQQQQFNEGAQDLEDWINGTKDKLNESQNPRDITEAEHLLKDHYELKDDIDSNIHRFENVDVLGNEILNKAPHDRDTEGRLRQLHQDQDDISNMWMDKNKQLHDGKELQIFLREADQIDSVTASHEAFLEFDDLGSTVDGVEALFKRHEDFENKLVAQDERIKALSDSADKLLSVRHPESKLISTRRDQVVNRRQVVKQRCQERHEQLLASQAFHEFKRDAEELSEWIKEKYHIAADESYRDRTNLLPKLQKHQAFEAELKANNDQLQIINQIGTALIEDDHYESPQIRDILRKLNSEWQQLSARAHDRGEKLRQASRQELLNKEIEDAAAKLKEMEKLVNSDDVGKDLRGVKDLLKKHQMLEHEMDVHSDNLNGLIDQGRQMAREGHFDSESILKSVEDFDKNFKALKDPMARRRQKLEDSRRWHQFNFDADGELQWIQEHMPAASSTDYGKSLIDTQNLHKKHQKFELELQGHQPLLVKVVQQGESLANAGHFASPNIKKRCADLNDSWHTLLENSMNRRKKLDLALQKQQYFADVNDIESWLGDKQQLLANQDTGRDEDSADKMLAKHKALEATLDTYNKQVADLRKKADELCKIDPQGASDIRRKQHDLENQLADLQNKVGERGQKLGSSKSLYQYLREAGDLQDWIKDQMIVACSEDYGQDFEHVQEIDKKFSEFCLGIEAGSARFKQCEQMAARLMDERSPYSATILEKQEQLREAWTDLSDQVKVQAQKLHGAMEIHRFNRDVEDALYRIREKYGSIPDELGRDVKQVQTYQKKHEAFENELAALEAQLQVLVDDSARLQEAYPGGNADQIEQQQQIVVENWTILQEKAAKRRDDLQAALDLYRFLASARDLETWASEMMTEMSTEQQVQHVGSVIALKERHQQLRAEIDTREDIFSSVIDTGKAMIDGQHFASEEIEYKSRELLSVREDLHSTWQQQNDHLSALYEQQLFYREAQHLQDISASQEAYLNAAITADSVEQVETLVKKHENFEKLLATQENKLVSLHQTAEKLLAERHFDSENIGNTLNTVSKRRDHIKNLSAERMQRLMDAFLYQQFNRDATEAESWIDDKLKAVREDTNSGAPLDLHEKMRKLQKHQAFEAEIVANQDRIVSVIGMGEQLIHDRRHHESPKIQQRLDALKKRWDELMTVSNNRGHGLEEAKDILKFNEEVDKVESWIREKDMLVSAADTGRDYEHCLELQRRMGDNEDGVAVDEERIEAINVLGDRLLKTPRDDMSDIATVKDKMGNLNNHWSAIQGSLRNHRDALGTALEVHAFNRDVEDLNDRINEKALAVSVDDFGKDLAGVQALQRKQDEVERDMTALQNQLEKEERQSTNLCRKYPNQAPIIQDKQRELLDNWERLEDLANARNLKLADSFQLHRFLTAAKEHITWCTTMQTNIKSGELAKSVLEAEEQLEIHHERKAEVDGRLGHYQSLKEHGEKLLDKHHFASEDIQGILKQLDSTWITLNEAWDERKRLLTQCYDLQIYEEYAEQADSWLSSKEAFLANEDVGHSISGVDALLKKHSGFEKTLEAQEEKIQILEQLCQALLAQEHYASDIIEKRCADVLARRERLRDQSEKRKEILNASRLYQLFLRNVSEVTSWMSSKIQVATDESYRDSTNLQRKIQKHQAFEAEVLTNRRRIEAVNNEGTELINNSHFASKDVKDRLEEVQISWRGLDAASQEKKVRLQEAHQALLYSRQCDDLESWIDEIETQLTSEDHGKDISTAKTLLKKHQLLEQDITNHQKVHELLNAVKTFKQQNHFMHDEMNARIKALFERYQSLNEPCQIRRDNLEDALLLYQFYRDVADELSWIQEKQPLASSTDLGNSLTAVQNLQKKHQALESEIVSHVPMMSAVADTAQHMINNKHYACADVSNRLDELQIQLQVLKDYAAQRRAKLLDAVESQMFYSEVAEAESWMREKRPLVMSTDFGTDQDSVQALLKKTDALDLDIDNFHNNIGELAALCQGLVQRKHFDSENIQSKQSAIEILYRELQDRSASRRAKLVDNQKLFDFYRESDEVTTWMKDREAIASSEDYGTDLEHVEVLQQKFDNFLHDLSSNEERVTNVTSLAETLLAGNHGNSPDIRSKSDHIKQMWMDVNELANSRQESLSGARQVHTFVSDTDDAIEWIQEKDMMVSSENFGHDLESVRDLIVKHEGLDQDLAAISKGVETITSEAERLLKLFPDAKDHIHSKHEEMVQAWEALVTKSKRQREKLQQAEELQMYFNDYRELLAWCTEMLAVITADDLARDVGGAETMITRHKEHKAEIDTRSKDFIRFTHTGEQLIKQGHFLSTEIQEKIDHLNTSLDQLLLTWTQRLKLYEQNLDLLQLRRDIDQLDTWLNYREAILGDTAQLGDSIDAVEEQIIKHEDFMKTVDAQAEKFNAIKRKTLLELAFAEQKQMEHQHKVAEEKRREKERLDEKTKLEHDRILEERRREQDQRKAQDLIQRRAHDLDEAEQNDGSNSGTALSSHQVASLVSRTPSFKSSRPTDIPVRKREDSDHSSTTSPLASPTTTRPEPAPRSINMTPSTLEDKQRSLSDNKPPPHTEEKHRGLVPSKSDGWHESEAKPRDPAKRDKPKRTLSLRTNRHSQSFKDKYRLPTDLPPSEMEGYLERKQELQNGGKKATIRSWKNFYTVLCGQLLCFFRDRQAFQENSAGAPPLVLHQAICEIAKDYTKKKNVLRLKLHDGSEYLFEAATQDEMVDWLRKIAFYADGKQTTAINASNSDDETSLAPAEQLQSFHQPGHIASPASPTHSSSSRTTTSSSLGTYTPSQPTIPQDDNTGYGARHVSGDPYEPPRQYGGVHRANPSDNQSYMPSSVSVPDDLTLAQTEHYDSSRPTQQDSRPPGPPPPIQDSRSYGRKMSAPHVAPPAPPRVNGAHNGNDSIPEAASCAPYDPSHPAGRSMPPAQASHAAGRTQTLPHGQTAPSAHYESDHAATLDHGIVPPSKADKKRHSVLGLFSKKKKDKQ